jgi:predicted alpha/beta hydrolase family esterase
MKNALILHGTNGSPEENWFPWLKSQLEMQGYKVWLPELPQANEPNIKRYNNFIFSSGWEFNEESVLIGHSSGSVAIYGILSKLPEGVQVKQAILVGTFKDDLGWPNLSGLFQEPFDYAKIKTKAKKFSLLHSDNDPHCPLSGAEFLAKELGGELTVIPNAEHFSIKNGGERFRQLPVILDLLQN